MAVSVSTISAGAQSAVAADKPVVLVRSVLDDLASNPDWKEILTGSAIASGAAASVANANAPGTWAVDRHLHLYTKPADQTTFGYALIFALNSAAGVFDALGIFGHNFGDLSGTINCSVWVSDNQSFTNSPPLQNAVRIAQWEGFADNARLVAVDLGPSHGSATSGVGAGEYKSYTGVLYVQVAVRETSEAQIAVPQIGEVILGRRGQFSQRPVLPWSEEDLDTEVRDAWSKGAALSRVTHYEGQGVFAPTWEFTGSDLYGLDDQTTLRDLYTDSQHGRLPFLFVPSPATSLTDAFWCALESPRKRHPVTLNSNVRRAGYVFREIAPFVSSE